MVEVHKFLLHILRPASAHGTSDSRKAEEVPRKIDERHDLSDSAVSLAAGDGKSSNGSRVTSVLLLNPRKVKVCFADGKEQIMDLKLAIRQGYAKEI